MFKLKLWILTLLMPLVWQSHCMAAALTPESMVCEVAEVMNPQNKTMGRDKLMTRIQNPDADNERCMETAFKKGGAFVEEKNPFTSYNTLLAHFSQVQKTLLTALLDSILKTISVMKGDEPDIGEIDLLKAVMDSLDIKIG